MSASAAPAIPAVTRAQALAHRLRTQGLDRPTTDPARLAVWDLGLQDSPAGSAALALAARLRGGPRHLPDLTDARSFATVWATRGAPVVFRVGDLAAVAAALWPGDDADAVARLAGNGQQLRTAGLDPIDAIRVTAEALRDVVTERMTKGEASTAVSARIPDDYVTWCRPCQAHHLGDQLMRVAGLPAGLRLVPGATPATLEPIARWAGPPAEQAGADAFVRSHLHLYGPTTPKDVGTFLDTSARAVKAVWPDHLAEVTVDGTKAWLPEEDVDDLLGAEPTSGVVRLLPRSDPWLLARDRAVVMPEAAHRKALWPTLGWPGAVFVDGEVAGTWRTKATAKRLELTVTPFGTLAPKVRKAIAEESVAVATTRGYEADATTIAYAD